MSIRLGRTERAPSSVVHLRYGAKTAVRPPARPQAGEMWLLGAHIAEYGAGSYHNHEPTRPRKLLLHRKQLRAWVRTAAERGLSIIPLGMYLKDGMAKVELGLGKGRKQYDKRQAIAKRDAERDIQRTLRERQR